MRLAGERAGHWRQVESAARAAGGGFRDRFSSLLAPKPHGHWVEHLSSVGLKSAQLVLVLVLVTMLGWRTLSVLLLISFAVVAAGIAFQVIGDYQVADSIWRTRGDPGFGGSYTEGHDMSGLGDLLVIVGGLAFAITAGIARPGFSCSCFTASRRSRASHARPRWSRVEGSVLATEA